MRLRRKGSLARRVSALLVTTMLVTGCQSLVDQPYEANVRPSTTPQIVDEVQKNDPRAQMGAREHPRIVASYGGEYKDAKTERLVARITGALTAVSENPSQSYRITILNSPAINAFALPGGYLYVTRGLLALANDASEVAAVLSHEMAHVTANHGIERQRREEAEVLASRVVAEVLSSDLAGKQALIRGKLRLAAFSRNQELQADVIGVRMLGEAGYDPYSASRFLDSMAAYARFTAVDPDSDQSLDFLSSHPNAPQRVELARRHARAFGPEGSNGDRGRDYYLAGIDGLLLMVALGVGVVLTLLASQEPAQYDTRLLFPFFKWLTPDLGAFYILFAVLLLVFASNGVNMTDGLDGLAISTFAVSAAAFTALTYVTSHFIFAQYLLIAHIEPVGELTIICGALVGASLGFLWWNAHPAQIFMGDVGSLALGGAIGTVAILIKQELLLPIVGGVFVIEGLSVIIQVVSFKLTGRRVFRMAPIHHHFELIGWQEPKIIMRFLILAIVFALFSLTTLKLR